MDSMGVFSSPLDPEVASSENWEFAISGEMEKSVPRKKPSFYFSNPQP